MIWYFTATLAGTWTWYWYLIQILILILFSGHTAGIKQALFNTDERRLISCGDDKTLRFWDIASGQEIKKIDLTNPVGGIELSKDQDILTVAHGQTVSFFNSETFEKIKEVNLPTTVFTASLYVLIITCFHEFWNYESGILYLLLFIKNCFFGKK